MGKENRKLLGSKGRQHVLQNYNFANFQKTWVKLFDKIIEENGTHLDRKNYSSIKFQEVA